MIREKISFMLKIQMIHMMRNNSIDKALTFSTMLNTFCTNPNPFYTPTNNYFCFLYVKNVCHVCYLLDGLAFGDLWVSDHLVGGADLYEGELRFFGDPSCQCCFPTAGWAWGRGLITHQLFVITKSPKIYPLHTFQFLSFEGLLCSPIVCWLWPACLTFMRLVCI